MQQASELVFEAVVAEVERTCRGHIAGMLMRVGMDFPRPEFRQSVEAAVWEAMAKYPVDGERTRHEACRLVFREWVGTGSDHHDYRARFRYRFEGTSVRGIMWSAWRGHGCDSNELTGATKGGTPKAPHKGVNRIIDFEWEQDRDDDQRALGGVRSALWQHLSPADAQILTEVYLDGNSQTDLAIAWLAAQGNNEPTPHDVRKAEQRVWKKVSRARKRAAAALPDAFRELARAA